MRKEACSVLLIATFLFVGCDRPDSGAIKEDPKSIAACAKLVKSGFRAISNHRENRFVGKVQEYTAQCRGGEKAVKYRDTPWLDWANYYAAGDASSKAPGIIKSTGHLSPNGRGIDGALLDLEYERIELIKFNLFDNNTYEEYIEGKGGVDGPSLKVWKEMRLPKDHLHYQDVGGDEDQLCKGKLIRHRTLTGICNDIRNPLMGSTNQLFARNVQLESTFPRLSRTELIRNRHGNRVGLLKPDPQVISRKLFTRAQSQSDKCREGYGLAGYSKEGHCDYKKAPFFNVLAAFWIQFMNHDWFSHLEEGHNQSEKMEVGCAMQLVENVQKPLTQEDVDKLGCRPDDRMDKAYIAEDSEPGKFVHKGKEYLTRAPKTFKNTVTAWWDASQIYGYDETSRKRVKRDPNDRAKLLLVQRGARAGPGEKQGYLPLFERRDPINPAWAGQEATAFPDNWTIGLSFYHNLFAREHNVFVDTFRAETAKTPDADSGLRNPERPNEVIRYKDVTPDELFEVARLVVSAEIAKIHTIEWTPQLLYNEPLYRGMNANWNGLFADKPLVSKALERIVVKNFGKSEEVKKATQWYSVFASGPGIVGLGSHVYEDDTWFAKLKLWIWKKDVWDLTNPDHVNGGINHFGSPFNFPEEFITVYRLHPLLPDLIEYREWKNDPNVIRNKIPVVKTFRGGATKEMHGRGLANWALSMGRQRLGSLTLHNHAQFLQNLFMRRLNSKIDVAALDLIRDRERGVPRFNEFRRQYGLKQLTSFGDFVDKRLPEGSPARVEQEKAVKILREVYGQHKCDASKVIAVSQVNEDGSPINDCLGHPDGTMVDNIEDVDTVVGWLAGSTRPHGFAISETQFVVFILNASRRLFSDRFFTSSFRPEFYTHLGVNWVNDNGPDGKVMEKGEPNGHRQEVSPLKRVLQRTMPELAAELESVVNVFDPWARDRGEYYSLAWKPRPGAESDEAFSN
ncbi:MAG: oxygenase [Deltaproteobacteria bacterium]|nr:oxygenase [Deltaproteobacteria bacterium]